jgi:hypothetical protein
VALVRTTRRNNPEDTILQLISCFPFQCYRFIRCHGNVFTDLIPRHCRLFSLYYSCFWASYEMSPSLRLLVPSCPQASHKSCLLEGLPLTSTVPIAKGILTSYWRGCFFHSTTSSFLSSWVGS